MHLFLRLKPVANVIVIRISSMFYIWSIPTKPITAGPVLGIRDTSDTQYPVQLKYFLQLSFFFYECRNVTTDLSQTSSKNPLYATWSQNIILGCKQLEVKLSEKSNHIVASTLSVVVMFQRVVIISFPMHRSGGSESFVKPRRGKLVDYPELHHICWQQTDWDAIDVLHVMTSHWTSAFFCIFWPIE